MTTLLPPHGPEWKPVVHASEKPNPFEDFNRDAIEQRSVFTPPESVFVPPATDTAPPALPSRDELLDGYRAHTAALATTPPVDEAVTAAWDEDPVSPWCTHNVAGVGRPPESCGEDTVPGSDSCPAHLAASGETDDSDEPVWSGEDD